MRLAVPAVWDRLDDPMSEPIASPFPDVAELLTRSLPQHGIARAARSMVMIAGVALLGAALFTPSDALLMRLTLITLMIAAIGTIAGIFFYSSINFTS